jgi:L-malate glycosyltransferase
VGTSASDAYSRFLRRLIESLALEDHVELVGSVSDTDLDAHYRAADVFVCLSDHEGFGVPLLEAMRHRVPVVALSAAAVPETVGDAGLLLSDKDPVRVAAAAHLVVGDPTVRSGLIERGVERLGAFSLAAAEAAHLAAVESVLRS